MKKKNKIRKLHPRNRKSQQKNRRHKEPNENARTKIHDSQNKRLCGWVQKPSAGSTVSFNWKE